MPRCFFLIVLFSLSCFIFVFTKSGVFVSKPGHAVQAGAGLDLVPYPPLVIKGDFHHQPFDDETFDFEFSNVFDHALYPDKFVGEIQRTLKGGGICVIHVAISRRSDKYSANDLFSIHPLIKLFNGSDLVYTRKVDGFGLDTEVVFRKKKAII
nr:S-adenosyl-L-methionine-dependent methyltransferases superfamily protein [Tanacetum cinerariifolium]GEY51306.1 S-adenosyl-L-methionine-dependent methyltransferases superfamily protein [Tanacetum cinerariifolium]